MDYKTVEDSLAKLHAVLPERRAAFRSRLRVLRDMGVPKVKRVGKGARVDYSFSDFFEVHLGLHLEHFGYPPSRVKYVVGMTSLKTFDKSTTHWRGRGDTSDLWMLMSFRRQADDGSLLEDGGAGRFIMAPIDEITELLKKENLLRFHGVVNMTALVRECMVACGVTSL